MEGHVVFPSQPVMRSAPLFAFRDTTRVMQFDTEINAEDEDREVKPDTDTVTPKLKKDGSLKSVKVKICEKNYKAKKNVKK